MRRADRLFQLVQLLRARRFATAEQLAAELRVSKRTIYRDIRDLETSGVPIRGEAGVGYRLERGFELPPLTFNAEEIEALVLGARIVDTWADPELAAAARSALVKVENALPGPMREVLLRTALFAPGVPWAERAAAELATLRRAVAESRKLHFAYRRADGDATERTVWPLGLYFWGRSWSLAAWCELREDYRSFRPDRMRDVAMLDEDFAPTDEISLEAFLARVRTETWDNR